MASWFDGIVREIDVRVQQQMDKSDKKIGTLIDTLWDRIILNEPAHVAGCMCELESCRAKRKQK